MSKKAKAEAGATVWVVTHYHSNGTEFTVHDSSEAADAKELSLLAEGLSALEPEQRRHIIALLVEDRIAEAFAAYAEACDESFQTTWEVIAGTDKTDSEVIAAIKARWLDED